MTGIFTASEYVFKYGISSQAILGFLGLSLILGSEKIADYTSNVKAARLALSLLQRFPNSSNSGFMRFVHANFCARWEMPLKDTFKLFDDASRESMSQGNIGIAITSLYCKIQTEILAGIPLEKVIQEADTFSAEAKKTLLFS